MEYTDFALRIGSAVLFGLLIGVERQLTGHAAGVRINVLVSLGACVFSLFPLVIGAAETTRVAAQIVTGVGFLCSGIIFKDGVSVRGLNTAATIWCTAAIGMLASSGLVLYGGIATALLLAVNLLLRPLAATIRPIRYFSEEEHEYLVTVTCTEAQEFTIRGLVLNKLRDSRLLVTNLESNDVPGERVEIEATLLCTGKRRDALAEELVARVSAEKGVTSAGWQLKEQA